MIKALSRIMANCHLYEAGDTLELDSVEEQRLILLGVAQEVQVTKPEPIAVVEAKQSAKRGK